MRVGHAGLSCRLPVVLPGPLPQRLWRRRSCTGTRCRTGVVSAHASLPPMSCRRPSSCRVGASFGGVTQLDRGHDVQHPVDLPVPARESRCLSPRGSHERHANGSPVTTPTARPTTVRPACPSPSGLCLPLALSSIKDRLCLRDRRRAAGAQLPGRSTSPTCSKASHSCGS